MCSSTHSRDEGQKVSELLAQPVGLQIDATQEVRTTETDVAKFCATVGLFRYSGSSPLKWGQVEQFGRFYEIKCVDQ